VLSAAFSVTAAILIPAPAAAENLKADISVNTSAGYARIVFNFSDDVESSVRLANNVLVITFKKPVDVSVDRLATSSDYISAARRDPDGGGVRFALKQKVRVNSMVAGERLFVDLLPESWTSAPPSLPQEVVEDLSRRVREAERELKQQKAAEQQAAIPVDRVHVSTQPTFTRYTFEIPELTAVKTDRSDTRLTLTFGVPIKFDLTDAKLVGPQLVSAVDTKVIDTTTTVSFAFVGKVDARTFREDNSYVVDVLTPNSTAQIEGNPQRAPPMRPPEIATRPAADAMTPEVNGAVATPRSELSPARPPERMEAKAETQTPVPEQRDAKPPVPAAAKAPVVAANVAELPPPEPAKATAPPAVKPKAEAEAKAKAVNGAMPNAPETVAAKGVALVTRRVGDTIKLAFAFPEPVSAAIFTRTDVLWAVFDTTTPIAPGAGSEAMRSAPTIEMRDGFQIVRLKLDRPRLVSAVSEGATWTIEIADTATHPSQSLAVLRTMTMDRQASIQIPLEDAKAIHRITDPEVGDELSVITALGPARGVLKSQDFVDFRTLATTHGLLVQPLADDLAIDVSPDRVRIGRPTGLTLTSSSPNGRRGGMLRPSMFDTQQWGFDRQAEFLKRVDTLVNTMAKAPESRRNAARMDLARFYFARDMYPEAKAVLDFALAEERPTPEDTTGLVMRGVAQIMMDRPEDGLRDINSPMVGNQNDAPLWRALANAKEKKWAEAREGLRAADSAIASLPVELQRNIMIEAIHASVEVRDFAKAESQLDELESLGPTEGLEGLPVLQGRIREGLGQNAEALDYYRAAAASNDRIMSAQGRMREIALQYRLGDMPRNDVIVALETLTAIWRGDETEAEALKVLAHLYIEDGRYREAFNLMRIAVKAHPDSEITRQIQDDAAAAFDVLFLGGKGDALPPIEALSLFYDFRELTPIGRRGDEMIRRLADRLISVDLLDQAAELLQHQIDHRLQGAARAQVATRLAVVNLLNRKPERALQVLKATRVAGLSEDLRTQRVMLEARALSDVGRRGLAADIVQNLPGPEAARLRSDILWAGKQYRESAEQIEKLYSYRWKEWTPLTDVERRDILRAAISYALADDTLGLQRFREKFGPMMAQGADRKAFDMATSPISNTRPEFQEVVKSIAGVDTLDQFIRDMRTRFPDAAASSGQDKPESPQSRVSLPETSTTGSVRALAAK
jgi:tetratricopeptide (TPR) repeat protein